MRIADLFENVITEMPIDDLEVHGMHSPGSFSDTDRRLLTNPDHIKKIRFRFAQAPHTFNLYFVNRPVSYVEDPYVARNDRHKATFTPEWYRDLSGHAGMSSVEQVWNDFGLRIKLDPEAVSVVFLSNANEESPIPMTPWIIAHRLGHALTDRVARLPSGVQRELDKLPDSYNRVMADSPIKYRDVLTMRSARTGILSDEEIREELIAQYLTGRVKFRLPQSKEGVNLEEFNAKLIHAERRIAVILDHLFDQCLGHVFIAV